MSSLDEKPSPSMKLFIDTWGGKGLGKGRCEGEGAYSKEQARGGKGKGRGKDGKGTLYTHRHEQEYCDLWAQKEGELDRANRWEATASHLRAAWIKEKERAAEKDAEIERLNTNLQHLQSLYMKLASSS